MATTAVHAGETAPPAGPRARGRTGAGTGARSRREQHGSDDSVARYLDEIGRHPLLTPTGERELAARIAAGRRAAEALAGSAPVPLAERRILERRIADGKQASEAFVNANLRLVVSVAKRYQASGVPLLDLIQEGNLGLIRAVQKFDHEKGFRFSTYAVWWIRQFVARGIATSRASVKLPSRANDELLRLREMISTFEQAGGRHPSHDELAEASGIPRDRVRDLLSFSDVVSLNALTGAEGDAELGDLVGDPRGHLAIDAVGDTLNDVETDRLLSVLDDREREIIRLRFGFGDGEPVAVGDVSERIGLSRERIRQLEHRAIAKLVHPSWNGVRYLRG